MSKKQNLLILGAGGFAKSIAEIAEDTQAFRVIGFVVNMPPFVKGSTLAGKPIWWVDELEENTFDCHAVCGLGSMARANLVLKAQACGIQFANVIHPSAYVAKSVKMGRGVIINSGAQIAADVTLGDHVIINRGALIGHGASIGDYAVIAPGANMASNVSVGKKTTVGIGAILIEHVNVGDQCFVGAGALLTKDVPDRVKVVGAPARIIETGLEEL